MCDTENQTGTLIDFTFRRYSTTQGRWISPDPAGLAAVDPTNPQSWNRYAYVMNQPLRSTDPLGLCSLVTTQTTTVSAGGTSTTTTTVVSTTPLWPGPCAAPPAGCMWISAGGSGEGSQWTGMQCGGGQGPVFNCPPTGCVTVDSVGGPIGSPTPCGGDGASPGCWYQYVALPFLQRADKYSNCMASQVGWNSAAGAAGGAVTTATATGIMGLLTGTLPVSVPTAAGVGALAGGAGGAAKGVVNGIQSCTF